MQINMEDIISGFYDMGLLAGQQHKLSTVKGISPCASSNLHINLHLLTSSADRILSHQAFFHLKSRATQEI
ncbi:hypothetical protein ABKN59_008424 [Abortiporus biennis]